MNEKSAQLRLGPYLLGPNDTPQNGIITGDARQLALDIPDESVDLILCDPIYQNFEDYAWLVEIGERILVEGGNLIAQCGHEHLPKILQIMTSGKLQYVWVLAEHLYGTNASIYSKRIVVKWKPFVWVAKGNRMGDWVFDMLLGGGHDKSSHKWQDSPRIFMQLIQRLVPVDGVVFDPFVGSGTVPLACKMMGRHYLGFEIEPDMAQTARERICQANPPLFVIDYEQLKIIPE